MKSVRLNADGFSLSQYNLVIVMTCYLHPKKSSLAGGDIEKKTAARLKKKNDPIYMEAKIFFFTFETKVELYYKSRNIIYVLRTWGS